MINFSFPKILIIAEAGVNHNGSLAIAKKLVDAAKTSGADAVKFQTFKAENLATKNAAKAGYQKKTTSSKESQFEMLKKLELSRKDHEQLIQYCRKKKIIFLSTAFDQNSADLLDELKIPCFKIPSGEITNIPLLKHIAHKHKPVILSTGMSELAEVAEAVEAIKACGNNQISLLHCVTEYPAPFDQVNLKAMRTLSDAFGLPVGFSDHTQGIAVALAAAACGAKVIEKHLTLDRTMKGPDHKASLEPDEFQEMVKSIRQIEAALGDGIKKAAPCEKKYIRLVRKSIVADRNIQPGQTIRSQDIVLKRPASGILPKDWEKVIGSKAKCSIRMDEVITWDQVES